MNTARLELPVHVRKKDRVFHRGMFVAANVAKDEDGTPLFGQVDSDVVTEFQENRKCQLCGNRIAKDDWCVFPGKITDTDYQEAPLHIACARYSAQVCPNIQSKKANYGFSVCVRYEFHPPTWHLDQGCTPTWARLAGWRQVVLSMAHDLERVGDTTVCRTCPDWNDNLGKMTFDEFMAWSARA